MIKENFGKTIGFIRKSKNITQLELSKGIISRSNLSRFENGNYEPSFFKVNALLERLKISLEEVSYIHNGYRLVEEMALHKRLVAAEINQDLQIITQIDSIVKVHLKAGQKEFETIYFLTQMLLAKNNFQTELTLANLADIIRPRLFNADNWFLDEFRLLNNFIFLFTVDEALFFTERAIQEFTKYENIQIENNLKVHILMNMGTLLLQNKELKKSANYFLRAKRIAKKENKMNQLMIIDCYLFCIEIAENKGDKLTRERLNMRLNLFLEMGYSDQKKYFLSLLTEIFEQ